MGETPSRLTKKVNSCDVHTVTEQIDPEIAQGLQRIHEEAKRRHAEILEMLMKSDPQANLVENVLGGASSGNH